MNRCGINFLAVIIFIVATWGCKLRPDNGVTTTAAVHFAGVFIMDNIPPEPNLRIQKDPEVKVDSDNTYHISGTVEGFTSFNAPVTIVHFSETLRYMGGNPNEQPSWECMDIYIGNKKLK